MTAATAQLSAHSLDVSVPQRSLVDALNLDVRAGEIIAVLGKNGSGKTLTLKTLAGLRAATKGEVRVNGSPIGSIGLRQRALAVGLLPQDVDDIFPTSVRATAAIGRYSHLPRFGWQSGEDDPGVNSALADMSLTDLAERNVLTLSGGERRRLALAQLLAQAPAVYLLDEPSNHLDPQFQAGLVRRFRKLADEGASVVASLHDVNIASRFADRFLLLFGDGRWRIGDAEDVLTESSLTELYGAPMQLVREGDQRLFVTRFS